MIFVGSCRSIVGTSVISSGMNVFLFGTREIDVGTNEISFGTLVNPFGARRIFLEDV